MPLDATEAPLIWRPREYTVADYIRDLEAAATRWEKYAAQARGPYKQDHIADGQYLAALFRGLAHRERRRAQERPPAAAPATRPRTPRPAARQLAFDL